jgi:hypothetical protein
LPIAAAAACAGLAALGFRVWFHPANRLVGFTICGSVVIVVTLVALIVMPAGRRALQDVKTSLRLLFGSTEPQPET